MNTNTVANTKTVAQSPVAALLSLLSSLPIEAARAIARQLRTAAENLRLGKEVMDGITVALSNIATNLALAVVQRRAVIDMSFGLGVLVGSKGIIDLKNDTTLSDEQLAESLNSVLGTIKGAEAKEFRARFDECATEIKKLKAKQTTSQAQLTHASDEVRTNSAALTLEIERAWALLNANGISRPKRVIKRRTTAQMLLAGEAETLKRQQVLANRDAKAKKESDRLAAAMAKIKEEQAALDKKKLAADATSGAASGETGDTAQAPQSTPNTLRSVG